MAPPSTAWSLVSLSPLGPRPLWGAALLLAAATLWAIRPLLTGRPRRPGLALLRGLAAAMLMGLLLQPALQLRVVRQVPSRLAIVVDRSRSMSLRLADGHSRAATAQAWLARARPQLAGLAQQMELSLYDLDGPITEGALAQPPSGAHSDLLAALERAASGAPAARPLAALLLLSDGADAELTAAPPAADDGPLGAAAGARLQRLGVPVNTVDVTAGEAFVDVAVQRVLSDEFAFVHNTFDIDVEVAGTGTPALQLPVTLRREGAVLATQQVALPAAGVARTTFKAKPDRVGAFVYEVEVPATAGEALVDNNRQSFVVHVVRDKVRVLQVAGRPSWDERFLRQHLKENPNADLISFFILRTPSDEIAIPEAELSLIPFPVQKLFTTELRSFDVIVFQNFDYRPYRMAQFLPNIRDAVRGGLGFVMVGGADSFGPGAYVNSPLEAILPLRIDAEGMRYQPVAPALTAAGTHHPVTDLTRGGASNEAVWRQLPAWDAANRTGGLQAGATALVTGAGAGAGAGGPPLVAAMDVDRGRSLAIATDAMWHWRFAPGHDGGAAERAYHRFWSNALRWLTRDPAHARVRVVPEPRHVEAGGDVEVHFTVLGPDYQPQPDAPLAVSLQRDGEATGRTDALVAGADGTARLAYRALPTGAYRVTARTRGAPGGGEGDGEGGSGVFVVATAGPEFAAPAPRPDVLAALAEATGGRALTGDVGRWDQLARRPPQAVEVDRRRNVELWDNGWAWLAVAGVLGLEWALRRRAGHP